MKTLSVPVVPQVRHSLPHVLAAAAGNPADPRAWSGIPYLICDALRDLGVRLTTVDTSFGVAERAVNFADGAWQLRHARSQLRSLTRQEIADVGSMGDRHRWVRSTKASFAASRQHPVASLSFSASGIDMPQSAGPVTLVEDMTISQVLRLPGHFRAWDMYGHEYLDRRAQRQGAQQRAAATIAFLNSWAADAAMSDYGLDADRVHVIGVGSRFSPYDGRRDWSVPRFLFVGADWARKNGDQVVSAFGRVRQRFPDATLDIVGAHPVIDAPGVTGHGYLSQSDTAAATTLQGLFRRSTCFVLPSSLEPSALVYAEACSQGLPSIGTIHGGSRDVFAEAGLAVDPHVAGETQRAMLVMAEGSKAEALGALAVGRAPLLTWSAVAHRLAEASGWLV